MTYTFVRVASCTTSPKTIHRYGWVRVRLEAESFRKRPYQEINEIHGVQYDKKPGVCRRSEPSGVYWYLERTYPKYIVPVEHDHK